MIEYIRQFVDVKFLTEKATELSRIEVCWWSRTRERIARCAPVSHEAEVERMDFWNAQLQPTGVHFLIGHFPAQHPKFPCCKVVNSVVLFVQSVLCLITFLNDWRENWVF